MALSIVGLAWAGCHKNAGPAQPQASPQKVTVAAVTWEETIDWGEFTGRTEAVETVEVRPRVSGQIQEVRFASGQLVKKGEVLFTIDPRWHQAEFDRREAEYQQAKVRQDTAEREAKRTAQLVAAKAISTEEAEARQARFHEARAALLAAEAARKFSRLDLELTEIKAPIDGRVSRAIVTAGNFVSGVAGNATLLTTIVTVDPVYVYADMDEHSFLRFDQLRRAKKLPETADGKTPVELQLAGQSGYPHQGFVESLDNRLDAGTGSILVRALFGNADGAILPGLFARIRVPMSARAPALLIAPGAVGTDQSQKFVLALTSSNTVQYRPVTLGPLIDGRRVVRGGLEAGEEIVVIGQQRVRPGMPVEPVRGTNGPAQGLAQSGK